MTRRHIDVEWRGLKKLERDLETFAKKAVPFAAREVVNSAAFQLQKDWQGEVKKTFTLRNQWTARSIQVDRARGLNMRTMEARTGSKADYMATQEDGGTVRGRSGAKTIPTEVAAGQAMGSTPRRRPVRMPNRVTSLGKVPRGKSGAGRKIQNLIQVRQAIKSGTKVAFLQLGRRKGLYRIAGSKKRPKIRKLYDLSRRSVRVKPEPTLGRAMRMTERAMPGIMKKAMLGQLKRHKVFGY